MAAVGRHGPHAATASVLHIGHQLRDQRSGGVVLSCREPRHPHSRRLDAVRSGSTHIVAGVVARALCAVCSLAGAGGGADLARASAANAERDLHHSARRIVDGPVLSLDLVLRGSRSSVGTRLAMVCRRVHRSFVRLGRQGDHGYVPAGAVPLRCCAPERLDRSGDPQTLGFVCRHGGAGIDLPRPVDRPRSSAVLLAQIRCRSSRSAAIRAIAARRNPSLLEAGVLACAPLFRLRLARREGMGRGRAARDRHRAALAGNNMGAVASVGVGLCGGSVLSDLVAHFEHHADPGPGGGASHVSAVGGGCGAHACLRRILAAPPGRAASYAHASGRRRGGRHGRCLRLFDL